MRALLLAGCFVLATTEYILGSAHMVAEDGVSTSKVAMSNTLPQSLEGGNPPSVLVVELPKRAKSKKGRKQRKNKFAARRPSPPANCVPLRGSCKSSGNVCCDPCAFCQCRLFRTVCFCRMGNPQC